ncbi:hypothetical protein QYE76_060596 [Lolium multiflorum]|uniref:Serine-threonine/tyrosine-protein kinase catalytic domain-containing protein n=1 Tax=Lolium multiflorum TaxID=4521 RepID=A0AAD8S0E0_LOLMU|nr:hypothetical protein QYE76_060596 [Lolium multiflorum]
MFIMAFQLKLLVTCLCIILLLPSIIFFSHAEERSCPGSEQERSNYIMKDSDGVLLVDEDSGLVQMPLDKLPDANANSTRVLSTINPMIELCRRRPDGLGVDESSFNVTIFMQNQTTPEGNSIFSLLILRDDALDFHQVNDSLPLAKQLLSVSSNGYALNLSNLTYRSGSVSNRDVYAAIGMLQANSVGVDIIIYPAASNYSVWIDYDRDRRLSVYVDVDGKPKPASAVAEAQLEIGSVVSPTSPFVHFGLLSTLEQRLRGLHFSATVDKLPDYPVKGGFLTKRVTLLSSILGSVATAAMVAVSVMCYFNSRYRRWHKELNQLAKSMERLPGMPTKVEFADIKKATSNFHETMKLGGGGFGTVYRCTLPAAASKTEWPMDVAVKRFTREVQNRRYGDFLAEVSIINRLRHKNIVPLVVQASAWVALSNTYYAVQPPLHGPETRTLIAGWWAHMTLAERSQPANAQNSPVWPLRFQDKRDIELARSAGRDACHFNRIGQRAWWQGREVDARRVRHRPRVNDVDPMCVPLFYPQAKSMALEAPPLWRPSARMTTSANSRSGSSTAGGRTRSSAHAPPSGGIVTHDSLRWTASAPARSTPGTLQRRRPKEEDAADSTPPPPAKKNWWEMEVEAQVAFRSGDNPKDFPRHHLIVGRSIEEGYWQITLNRRQSEVWSAMDHDENFVDLAGPLEPPAPKEEEDDWSFNFSDEDGGGDGDDTDNLDFSAFLGCH